MKTISLAGRSFDVEGDADDPYFIHLDENARELALLEAWVRQHLRPDSVIIDAGGNLGLTALLLATLVPKGEVHVFEAMPGTAAHLQANIARNGVGNCRAIASGLGDRAARVAMHGQGSAAHVAEGDDSAAATIPLTTIDAYAAEAGLGRVDFIKIDVEGYEPAVLAGAAGTIERHRPPIWMEFNSWCLTYIHGINARTVATALWSAFDVTRPGEGGTEAPMQGGPMPFLHDNAVLHRAMDDILLRLRPGAVVPPRAAFGDAERFNDAAASRLAQMRGELQTLRTELAALHASTSWRITAPLRALKERLHR